MRSYWSNELFDFGAYLGHEIGITFVTEIGYVEWCILNVEEFCIFDLDHLLKYGCMTNSRASSFQLMVNHPKVRSQGLSEAWPTHEAFVKWLMTKDGFGHSDIAWSFSNEAIALNRKRVAKSLFKD